MNIVFLQQYYLKIAYSLDSVFLLQQFLEQTLQSDTKERLSMKIDDSE